VQHLGKLEWPQDTAVIVPSLTQLAANDINDLHGEVSCDLIISTPGNYHMALRDAMVGRPDLGHVGLLEQQGTPSQFKVSMCWTTSPPLAGEHITAQKVQIKNITLVGRPALTVAPVNIMDGLVASGLVDAATRKPILSSRGNVILIRADKVGIINTVCDLGNSTRFVSPHPVLEPGSFGNFAGTIFNVASQNAFGCNATDLFNGIFSQNLSELDLSGFNNPYNIGGVLSVFGRGPTPQGTGARWVASSRIMHRDIPYALCHDEADAGIVFYHEAVYFKQVLAASGCNLEIVPLGGTATNPQPLPGNPVSTLEIAKVNGSYAKKVNDARDVLYDFFTTSPIWAQILIDHGITPVSTTMARPWREWREHDDHDRDHERNHRHTKVSHANWGARAGAVRESGGF
jgi:hypothetical protein